MIRNYLTSAFRHLARGRMFSIINLSGLVLGLASSLVIYLWVQDERRTDNFHGKGADLYRVYTQVIRGDDVEAGYNTPALLPQVLKEEVPEVELAAGFAKVLRLSQQGDTYESFQVGDKTYKMRGSRAGEDFFRMFSYALLAGNAATALSDPSGVAISRKMADLFFGGPDKAYGSTMTFSTESESREVVVRAVFEDLPSYSTDQFDYLANWDHWVENDDFKKSWGHFGTYTYVQLREGTDPAVVEGKLKGFLNKYLDLDPERDPQFDLGLQRFGEQHLYGNFENGRPSGGNIAYVNSLTIVAVFILIIACVNFMNLSIAGALNRRREVGIRKAAGAHRWNLITQFLIETLLLALVAIVLALIAADFLLPWFNTLTEKQLVLPLGEMSFVVKVLLLLVVTGVAAGSYPAFFLSAFQPARALKGAMPVRARPAGFGKGLVVFQFALSILLIIVTIVVSLQTSYIRNKDTGYDGENVLCIRLEGDLIRNYATFKREAMRKPGILAVDRSSQTPHAMNFSGPFVQWEGMDPERPVNIIPNSVGFDYVKLLDLTVVEGRDFSEAFPADTTNFIVSEAAVWEMGLAEPVGSVISVFGKSGTIVGVVNDYNGQSLHNSLMPIILDVKENLNFGTLLVRTRVGRTDEAINGLREVYGRLNPGYAFDYTFLDDSYQKHYQNEQLISQLSTVFGTLSIIISCLGLFGLAVFSAEQRTKEMSIRKILGATTAQIYALFSWGFVRLILISILLAVPLAWMIAATWLQRFAYRIDLSWWIFALGGVFAIALGLLTIFAQALRTGLASPARTLRSE